MGLFILLSLSKFDIEVRGSFACDLIIEGNIISIMPSVVLLFHTDSPFRIDNAVFAEQFLGVQPRSAGLFCRGAQYVGGLIAALPEDPLG